MQITFLPHAVSPRLVRHPLASAQLLYAEQAWWITD
jgi:hypothetical protein